MNAKEKRTIRDIIKMTETIAKNLKKGNATPKFVEGYEAATDRIKRDLHSEFYIYHKPKKTTRKRRK
jgi:hypothetical protein